MIWSVTGRLPDGDDNDEHFDIDLPLGGAKVGGTWPATHYPGKQWRFAVVDPEKMTILADLVDV